MDDKEGKSIHLVGPPGTQNSIKSAEDRKMKTIYAKSKGLNINKHIFKKFKICIVSFVRFIISQNVLQTYARV